MAPLPQQFIDQVKASVDMLELASRYTDLKKVGDGVYGGRCPNPNHRDTDPSFTVFVKDQSWCCYGCHHGNKSKGKTHADTNYGSDCFAFLQWISGGKINWRQAILKLAEEHNILLPTDEHYRLYEVNEYRTKAYQANLYGKPLEYLKARGLSEADCKAWRIGFDGKKITFSLMDRYKRVLGFTRRWLNPPENCRDKYRNSQTNEIFNKSYYFYGIHLYDSSLDHVYITEGSMDVILGSKYGLKNVMAPLGTSFTDQHAETIKNLGKTPIFIMDGDMAGLKSAKKAIDKLAALGVYAKIVMLSDGKDLADMANQLKETLPEFVEQHTMTYGYFKVKNIINQYDSKMMELRLGYFSDLKAIMNDIPGDERKVISDFIYERMKIDFKEDKNER